MNSPVSAGEPRKPRLLFLCQTLPYPPHGGVEARTFNVLRLLARDFTVTALCFYRKGGAVQGRVEESVEALSAIARVEAFPIPQEWSRLRLFYDHARSVLSRRVYTVSAYSSDAYRESLRSLIRSESFDLVHLDSMDLSGYLKEVEHLPVICVHHNVESQLLRRRSTVVPSAMLSAYLRFQSGLMAREEERIAPTVALNITVSSADADTLKRRIPSANFQVVPNGVDVEEFKPQGGSKTDEIVFLGGTAWFPNLDGMNWFCREVLPLLRERVPDASVTWVGKATEAQRHEFHARYGVKLTGYVPSIDPYLQPAGCFIVPLRFGGGTRLKILDAWAMGKAVISTSVGCEGLDSRDGEDILIRDRPADFADAIADVLSNRRLRNALEVAGRRTAVDRFSWSVIGLQMNATYRQIARQSHAEESDPGAPATSPGIALGA